MLKTIKATLQFRKLRLAHWWLVSLDGCLCRLIKWADGLSKATLIRKKDVSLRLSKNRRDQLGMLHARNAPFHVSQKEAEQLFEFACIEDDGTKGGRVIDPSEYLEFFELLIASSRAHAIQSPHQQIHQ